MKKNFVNIAVFFVMILFLSESLVIKGDTKISTDERRPLKQSDTINSNFLDGTYSGRLEDYLMDQFPFRYSFRKIKSTANFKLFLKEENENITVQDGYAIKLPMEYKYDQVAITVEKLNKLRTSLFRNNRKVYISLIPDKSYYYKGESSVTCDFKQVEALVTEKIQDMEYISLEDLLSLDMYYRTDSHWSQDKLIPVRDRLLESMGAEAVEDEYTSNTIEGFTGVYASQAALSIPDDTISYLTNETLKACTVINHENGQEIPLYNTDLISEPDNYDKYELFLSGSCALLEINNPNAKSNKVLYVCRDSFGSSLSPLLVEAYKTVYVIDLRYIDSSYVSKFITVNRTGDVLFLYSTLLMETPGNFKIN